MSQQINLVNLALLPPKPFFQFRGMALALIVMALVLSIFAVLMASRVSTYEQAAVVAAQRVVAKQAQLTLLEQKSGKRQPPADLLAEQAAVESEGQRLQMLAGQLAELGGKNSLHPRAALLFALAERPAKGLWLTGIEIMGDQVSLEGVTLQAGGIPVWLADLQRLPAFAGRRFGGLEVAPAALPGQAVGADPAAPISALSFRLAAMPATGGAP